MASELISLVGSLYGFVKAQKALSKDIQFQYNMLQISLTGIMEGLTSY